MGRFAAGQEPRLRGFVRQWKLLLKLDASRYGLTLALAAKEFAVSERTIRRDFDALMLAGFPIDAITMWEGTRFYLRRQEWRGGEGTIFPARTA